MPVETPNNPLVDDNKNITLVWAAVVNRMLQVVNSGQEAGTTAQRPASGLWVGRRYWDTNLQKPVYLAAVRPNVWRDAAGAVV